ncbi:hypothetical protein diail_1530 [Diaporthe ilicicola]|nr:hypothetical protein diail_1530 [Diaporthe ilicicola]
MAGGRPGRPPGRASGPTGRPPGRPRGSGRPRGLGRPPGRPRRDSNSTVASVDLSHVKYIPELSFLKPAPSINDYPTFVLDDAVVYRKSADGQQVVANVCNVNLEGPLVVRGKVEIEDEHELQLRNVSKTTAYVEIPVCEGYSIGYGPWAAVWASGKAGWYEINPAPEYQSMYDYMCEGITLYYKIIDAYDSLAHNLPKGKRYKALQTPIEKLFFKYSVAIGDGATLPDVKRRCQKHAPFLLAHFDQETEFNWKSTSFRKWLITTNEGLVVKLDAAKEKGPAPAPTLVETRDVKTEANDSATDSSSRMSVVTDRSRRSKSRASRQSAEKDVRMEDAPPAPPAPPLRSETYIPPPIIPPLRKAQPLVPSTPTVGNPISPAPAQTQDPVNFLLEVIEEILEAQGGDAQKLKESKLHGDMYLKCTIKTYAAPREITHFYASSLLKELPPKWNPSPFRDWLTRVVDQPWEPNILTREQIPSQCVRRKKKDKSGPKSKEDRENEVYPRGAGKRWPPSTLTPRPAALRPGASAKRPAVYHSDDDDERARKAARTAQDLEAEEEDEDSRDDSEDEDADDTSDAPLTTPTPALPIETSRLVIRAERIPSMSPSGPNATWRCEEDGCNYIVRSPEEAEGKGLIEKHFKDHTKQAEKMNLALSEGTRGHLPIKYAYFPPSFFVYVLFEG